MTDIGSYILYISVFAISIFGSWLYGKQDIEKVLPHQKFLYFLVIAGPIILLQGLRYDVGTDYQSYAGLSESFGRADATEIGWYENEPLFLLFSRLAYLLSGGNKYFFFLADAVVMNTLLFFAFTYFKRYEETMSLPILYFMYYFLCFPYFLNVERQGVATIIIWFSLRYVFERKPARFTLCILIAMLVHNTAIVGLLLYPAYLLFSNKSRSPLRYVAIVGSLFVPILFGIGLDFLSRNVPIFAQYAKFINEVADTRINVNWLFAVVMAIVLILSIKSLQQSKINCWYLIFLLTWVLSMYLLNYYIEWGFRMSFYFEIGLIYAYAILAANVRKRENKILLNAFLICMMAFHFTYKFYIQGNAEIFPYQTVLMMHMRS